MIQDIKMAYSILQDLQTQAIESHKITLERPQAFDYLDGIISMANEVKRQIIIKSDQ